MFLRSACLWVAPTMLALAICAAGAALGAAESAPDATAETWRLVATPVDVGPESISLVQLFADLQRQAPGLKIVVDESLTSFFNRDLGSGTIDFAARRIPVSEALTLALRDQLAWEVHPGIVRICKMQERRPELTVVRYPMARLLAYRTGPARSYYPADAEFNKEELTAIIMRTVHSRTQPHVAAWMDEGGPAEVQWAGSSLLVSQTREGHDRLAAFLLALSRALGLEYDGPKPQGMPEDQAVAEVRRLLARRIDVDFESASVEDALDYIRQSCPGLNLVVAPDLAPVGVDRPWLEHAVRMKVKHMPVEQALRYCMAPSYQVGTRLGWEARPGYVLVGAEDNIRRGELPLAMYPVRDLEARPTKWSDEPWGSPDLIAVIQRTVCCQSDEAVAAWSDEGGPAEIGYMGGLLIVAQTPQGHEQVGQLLNLLRAAMGFAAGQSSRPRAAVPCFAFPDPPELAATYEALEMRMDVDFKDVPLMQAVGAVAERAPYLGVVVEPAEGLPERVTLKRQGATRREILENLIGKNARCQAQRGYVSIRQVSVFVPGPVAFPRLLLAAYPVGNLGRPPMGRWERQERLVRSIQSAVNHADAPDVAAWADDGGPAFIELCGDVLLVMQTPAAHRRISAVLQELRFRGRAGVPLP